MHEAKQRSFSKTYCKIVLLINLFEIENMLTTANEIPVITPEYAGASCRSAVWTPGVWSPKIQFNFWIKFISQNYIIYIKNDIPANALAKHRTTITGAGWFSNVNNGVTPIQMPNPNDAMKLNSLHDVVLPIFAN